MQIRHGLTNLYLKTAVVLQMQLARYAVLRSALTLAAVAVVGVLGLAEHVHATMTILSHGMGHVHTTTSAVQHAIVEDEWPTVPPGY